MPNNIDIDAPIATSNDESEFEHLEANNFTISYSEDRFTLGEDFFEIRDKKI